MAEQQLPEGWVLTSFTDLLETKSGNSKLIKGKLSDTNQHNLYPGFSASGQDVWLTTFEHEHEAVIVSAVGARCGKTFLAKGKWSAIANTHIIKPFSACINIRFLHYLTNREEFWVKGGSAQPFVKVAATFERQDFLPPLAEQQVIADTLDRLLAQVERSKARLQRIPQLLKRFRQSVLAAAVSGKLTEEWRGEVITKIGDICLAAFDGPFGSKLKSSDYTLEGIYVARLENVGHMNFISSKETFISPQKHQELEKNTLQENDILFSSFVDEEIRVCLFPFSNRTYINKADCFCLRVDIEKCLPAYLMYLLASRYTYDTLSQLVQGVTRPRINLSMLKAYEITIPSLDTQSKIVSRVEQLFAYADRIEQQAQAALARVNHLTQAILAKAFRGELTEQWRRDNPHLISGDHSATALLARIQAERAKAPAKGRGRKSNPSQQG